MKTAPNETTRDETDLNDKIISYRIMLQLIYQNLLSCYLQDMLANITSNERNGHKLQK